MENRRDMLVKGLSAISAGLTSSILGSRLLAQPANSPVADLRFVAPELRPFAAQVQAVASKMPPLTTKALPALRATEKKWAQPPVSDVPWQKVLVPGTRGNPDVAIFVINAKPRANRGGIVYMHGGGYITGGAALEIRRSQELASTLDCTIVSVEYRLAPETRHIGSLEDNYAALAWTFQHAAELGIDPSRIVVAGESAGGGHAALLAIAARDRRQYKIAFQCLVYPMLDDRTGTSRTVPPHIGTILWTPKTNAFGWQSFLGRSPGVGDNPAGVPAREADLTGLPPAWIGVGAIDLFMEENVNYAERLLAAGVPTELLVVPGAFHGFDVLGASTQTAKRFTSSKVDALRRALTSDVPF